MTSVQIKRLMLHHDGSAPGRVGQATPDSRTTPAAQAPAGSPFGHLSWTAGHLPSSRSGVPLGGDFFEAIAVDDRHVLLAIGDVSGHGLAVAPVTQGLRSDLQRVAGVDPAAVVTRLDECLARAGNPELLATAWVGVLDVQTGMLRTANAGHPPPVCAWGGAAWLLGEATAPPLGTGQVGRCVRTGLVHLPRGAFLVAYTDGAVERRGADPERQLLRLRSSVQAHVRRVPPHGGTEDLFGGLLDGLDPAPPDGCDDISMVVLRRERGTRLSR